MIDLKKIEENVREFWEKNKINEKLIEKPGKSYFLLDGPPYANFTPHAGHIKNTVFKDMLIRLAFMKGHKVLFQPGFDTHGLPVENMVEKKLDLKSKKDIEKYGVDRFMKDCKNSATLNKELWMNAYKDLGGLYALKKPYITYEDDYISSAWWAFSEMYKKEFVYEGEKPVMWCPHCETSLAGYEVTDSYKEVVDPGVYVLFKLKDSDEHLLVFTTTPWTLPANVAVAIAPNEDYVVVEVSGKKVIIAKERLTKLSEMEFGYSVLRELKGKELVGKKYLPLLDVPLQRELEKGKLGKAHEVVASIALLKERVASKMRTKTNVVGEDLFEEFVSVKDGSGMVHVAPGHGKTDNIVGMNYNLACVSPLDDRCYFKEEAGFEGYVKDNDKKIIEILKEQGKLLFEEKIKHNYPLCWRCKSPLIFRLSKQLFFKVDEVKKKIEKINKKVEWYPEFARERFDNWVLNAEDWNISRNRYWGIPIPIWKSEDGDEIVISGKEELEKLSGEKIQDLHVIDDIVIEKNNKKYKRVKWIFDVWFDSGVAPWASLGYPFKNKELFEENFPVSRINEAQDQIRGWFYSLMFCSAAVFDKPAYEKVSMTGWVLDKSGNKMSKSLGNVISAEQAIDELGADVLRYYFCSDMPPYETQKFNFDIAKKEVGKVMNVLWNLQNLVSGELKEERIEDRWIISRLENVTKNFDENIEKFEFSNALKELSEFILNDLSRGYIQMTRENLNGKIILECLGRVLKLIAPISPFISEEIWQKLKEKNLVKGESIHLENWPKINPKKIDNEIEKEFSNALKVIEIGLRKRDQEKIGLRWPLSKAVLYSDKEISKEVLEMIANQLNVKKTEFKQSKEIDCELEIKMNEELLSEGFAREIARKVQAERKEKGMKKEDLVEIAIYLDKELFDMIKTKKEFLKERTNSSRLEFKTIEIDGKYPILFTVKEKQIAVEFL